MFLSYRKHEEKDLIDTEKVERIIVLEGRSQYLFSFNPKNVSDIETDKYNGHEYSYMMILSDGSPEDDLLVNEVHGLENDLGGRRIEQAFRRPSSVRPKGMSLSINYIN